MTSLVSIIHLYIRWLTVCLQDRGGNTMQCCVTLVGKVEQGRKKQANEFQIHCQLCKKSSTLSPHLRTINYCFLFSISVPIVPNFILKLEEAAQNPENILNDTSSFLYTEICSNRTNDTAFLGPDYDVDFNLDYDVICEKKKEVNKTAEKILKAEYRRQEYEEYGEANVKAGIMFGSKALMQMLFNPFVGPITNR